MSVIDTLSNEQEVTQEITIEAVKPKITVIQSQNNSFHLWRNMIFL